MTYSPESFGYTAPLVALGQHDYIIGDVTHKPSIEAVRVKSYNGIEFCVRPVSREHAGAALKCTSQLRFSDRCSRPVFDREARYVKKQGVIALRAKSE